MENSPRLPQIFINSPYPVRNEEHKFKSLSPEPEVEENCEDLQIKEIVEGLGVDFSTISNLKYLSHQASPNCVHCKLLEKVKVLQSDIEKLSHEINTTEDVLKIKKIQNNDLKDVIERLEGTVGTKRTDDSLLDRSTKTCSCSNACNVI